MKRLCTILVLLVSISAFSQSDSVYFSNDEILNISNKILDLEQKDSLNNILILNLEKRISLLDLRQVKDSSYISILNQEMELRKYEVNLYKDLHKNTKPKWYDSKPIWFGMGFVSVLVSSWVVSATTP